MEKRSLGPSVPLTWQCALVFLAGAALGCSSSSSAVTPSYDGPPSGPLPVNSVDAGGPVPPPPFGARPVYNPVVSQSVPPPPISGGTLAVSSHGPYAFAADSDRDALYVVDLNAATSVTVALRPGDEPGRVVEDASGRVHVVLRGSGAVATIDPGAKTVLARTSVCARPRGIAYMPTGDSLYVACAGGELVTLPAAGGAVTRSVFVEPDLRDAVVVGEALFVSELRSAAILQIAADGTIANRFARPLTNLEPGVAWRMIATPGGLGVSLQGASETPISSAPGSYGSGGCGGAVTIPEIGTWSLDGSAQSLTALQGVLPVDLALSPDKVAFAVVVPGQWLVPGAGQLIISPAATLPPNGDAGTQPGLSPPPPPPPPPCAFSTPIDGQAIAVAYDPSGKILVQTREPARLVIDALSAAPKTVSLSSISRDDSGHEIFHSDQGGGISCASCHIEGGDDGRTWLFGDVGARRTPSVLGTVQGTAPYHWDGSQTDLPTLYKGSLARMNGAELEDPQAGAFTAWLGALPGPAPSAGDAAAIARGQALFAGAGACSTCHSGPKLTNNQTVDIGTGRAFQVPPLVGVAARAPFLHDGCAPTLVDAIGACGHASSHGGTAGFSSAQLADLAIYLGSL